MNAQAHVSDARPKCRSGEFYVGLDVCDFQLNLLQLDLVLVMTSVVWAVHYEGL